MSFISPFDFVAIALAAETWRVGRIVSFCEIKSNDARVHTTSMAVRCTMAIANRGVCRLKLSGGARVASGSRLASHYLTKPSPIASMKLFSLASVAKDMCCAPCIVLGAGVGEQSVVWLIVCGV